MDRIRASLAFALALGAALLIAACGGGNDEDPEEVLSATFNNDETVESGVFDVSLNVEAEGGDDAGSFEATLGGPFQSQGEGRFPAFDVDAEIDLSGAQDFSGSGGLISTGDAAFINFQDTDYEVPKQLFDQFATQFTRLQEREQGNQGGNLLQSLGIEPTNWVTDLENEGTEDVEGTETIHISGTADTPKLIEDIKQIAENAPQASGQLGAPQLDQLDELGEIITSADFDFFSGEEDDILRKLEANIEFDPPDTEGAPESVTLDFSVTLSEVNEPQTVSPPSSSQPLGDLLRQFGLDEGALNQLGGGGGGLPQAGGSTAGPGAGGAQAYQECLAQAQGAEAVQQCAELLLQ